MKRSCAAAGWTGLVLFALSFMLLTLGCVRPDYDQYSGEANVLGADAVEAGILDLQADNAALRDSRLQAAFAITQQKADKAKPVTAPEFETWLQGLATIEHERNELIRQAVEMDRRAAASQPVAILERQALEERIRANAADRDRLAAEGKTLLARLAAYDPVTAADLQRLHDGVAVDRAERGKIAEIVRKTRVAAGAIRALGYRSQAIAAKERQFLQTLGVSSGEQK